MLPLPSGGKGWWDEDSNCPRSFLPLCLCPGSLTSTWHAPTHFPSGKSKVNLPLEAFLDRAVVTLYFKYICHFTSRTTSTKVNYICFEERE